MWPATKLSFHRDTGKRWPSVAFVMIGAGTCPSADDAGSGVEPDVAAAAVISSSSISTYVTTIAAVVVGSRLFKKKKLLSSCQ